LTFWLTGLSGAGKTTIAREFEARVFNSGGVVVWLDGDTLRSGINSDLGFSKRDRSEHIRRTAEIAKLLNQSGALVVCSLISPFHEQRAQAKEIVGADSFVEVHVNASLEVCEQRDPHGLYAKARAGDVSQFTGIDARYEAPEEPRIVLNTESSSVTDCVDQLMELLQRLSKM
jgi:adenylyl-sulfate kinase